MLDSRDKKHYNMLVLEAKFLKAELLMNEDIFEDAQAAFAEAYNRVCDTCPLDEQEVLRGAMEGSKSKEDTKKKSSGTKAGQNAKNVKKNKNKEQEEDLPPIKEIKKNPDSQSVKKLYRAIAKESHPDTLLDAPAEEAKKKQELFRRAQQASEKADLSDLLDIAEDLNITPPDPNVEHIKILKKNVKSLKEAIKMVKDTTAWQWYHTENEETKEAILIRYMQYVYQTFK